MSSGYGMFPDPFADQLKKLSPEYGLKYGQAIESQWGRAEDQSSLFRRRLHEFETNRDYATGNQDTAIYKQILTSMNPNDGDGSLLNLDWSPVPIIPKFVKVVVNRVLSRKPYPSVEAIDPVSREEKQKKKAVIESSIENKQLLKQAKSLGLKTEVDPDKLPDTTEESEMFDGQNIKTSAEISAQIATALTLDWCDFDQQVYRRCVEDLVINGMAVCKRENDPNYGITSVYVDPALFVHSYTEDPNMNDIVYAGHISQVSIHELKRLAGDQFTEEQYKELARKIQHKGQNNPGAFERSHYDVVAQKMNYGYDDYLVDVLNFEFISVDCVYYESKMSRYGNEGFYYKGGSYDAPKNSVFERKPYKMEVVNVYGGSLIVGTNMLFNYGMKKDMPRNIHDISRTTLSYKVTCTNLRKMMPKSMVSSVRGFADQLQLSHLKIQQAIAKAKPDGLIIDIEGLENVSIGKGGASLQPLQIQDIYEQTGVFYYRSKNPEGGFQNPPIREIGNQIRNIETLIGLYNHYLRMIRDATGVNEVMDASTPKGDALVGVRQQALAAGNNALYDITNSANNLYRKTCEDIIKCLQILPKESVLYQTYIKAIGKYNMDILSSFSDLPMYNFGVRVVMEMSDEDRLFLEQNLQQSLAQREIDLEDAMAVRNLKDIDQAQRLLVIRRKKRLKTLQDQQLANIQAQSQANAQAAMAQAQAKAQLIQLEAQSKAQLAQLEAQLKVQVEQALFPIRLQIEQTKVQGYLAMGSTEQEYKEKLEVMKEDRKDSRVDLQAAKQSRLIEQRKGAAPPIEEPPKKTQEDDTINKILGL